MAQTERARLVVLARTGSGRLKRRGGDHERAGVLLSYGESPDAELRRLRAVLDAADDAYICADTSGAGVDCNRAAERLFGIPRQELIGASLSELPVPAGLRDAYRRLCQQRFAVGRQHVQIDLTMMRPDGTEARIETSLWVTEGEGEPLLHAFCRDVTEQVRLQTELAEKVRRLAEAQSLATIGSWERDLVTGEAVWSTQLYQLFGIDESTPASTSLFIEHLHPEDQPRAQGHIDEAVRTGNSYVFEARFLRDDGEMRWICSHGATTQDAHGVPVRLSGTIQDITDRKLTELEFERLSVTDALTGLKNRASFDQHLESALGAIDRSGGLVSLLLLDLDGFKPVNDVHGHLVGDAVLRETSSRLADCIRPGDAIARIGGDEFGFVLPGADAGDATRIAQRLVETASTPVVIDDIATVRLGASVGIAIGTPSVGIGELRRQADTAMYTAKRSGRGRHVVFTQELASAGTESLTVRPTEARAWADYIVALRAEIARRKDEGLLPKTTRAPASAFRTLQFLVTAIEHLPDEQGQAELPLPDREMLEEFVFHGSLVQDWADNLVRDGVLTTRRSPEASAFWAQLQDETATPH